MKHETREPMRQSTGLYGNGGGYGVGNVGEGLRDSDEGWGKVNPSCGPSFFL